MENSREKNRKVTGLKGNNASRGRKTWVSPKLIVEDVESTRGGFSTVQIKGDDTWYKS